MSERYETMKRFQQDLLELFRLCGLEPKPVGIRPAPRAVRLVERLAPDQALYDYLNGLDALTRQAVQEQNDQRLEAWNDRQNELRVAQLTEELEQERARSRELEEKLAARETEGKQSRAPQTGEPDSGPPDQQVTDFIRDVIAMRDNLLTRKVWLEEQAPEEETARKLIQSQLMETARCLTSHGVEILEEGGAFDSWYQTVADTRPTGDASLEGRIADTFRPGYRFQGKVLRPQEVILFTLDKGNP